MVGAWCDISMNGGTVLHMDGKRDAPLVLRSSFISRDFLLRQQGTQASSGTHPTCGTRAREMSEGGTKRRGSTTVPQLGHAERSQAT